MAKTTFVDKNPAQGIQGTIVTAAFLNAVNNHRHMGTAVDGDGALDYSVDAGVVNAYAITLVPAITAYVAGMPILFKAAHANTGASTFNVNGLGAKAITRPDGTDLAAGDIQPGQIVVVVYDGTAFQMVSDPAVLLPPGIITIWATETPPAGWLECDGSTVSRSVFARLFAVIGTMYGSGDGSTTFNLPDLRGQFIRGWDHGASVDPGASARTDRGDGTTGDHIGTKQADAYASHRHKNGWGDNLQNSYVYGTTTSDMPGSASGDTAANTGADSHTYQGYTSYEGGNETRPKNVALMYVIKY